MIEEIDDKDVEQSQIVFNPRNIGLEDNGELVVEKKPSFLGRECLNIDEDLVFRLAKIDCTMIEMGAIIGCHPATLKRRFGKIIEEGKMHGNKSLRRKMWNMAQRGNSCLLMFLAKNRLGYRDKPLDAEATAQINVFVNEVPK